MENICIQNIFCIGNEVILIQNLVLEENRIYGKYFMFEIWQFSFSKIWYCRTIVKFLSYLKKKSKLFFIVLRKCRKW